MGEEEEKDALAHAMELATEGMDEAKEEEGDNMEEGRKSEKKEAKGKGSPKAKGSPKKKAKAKAKGKAKSVMKKPASSCTTQKLEAEENKKKNETKKDSKTKKTDEEGKGPKSQTKGKNEDPKDPKEKKSGKRALEEKAKAIQLTQSSDEEGEGEEEEKPSDELDEKRHPKKAYVFNKLLATLPETVQSIFNDKTVSRAQKTKLVNNMVEENSKGKFVLKDVADCPVAQALSKQYNLTKGKEKAKGYPRCVIAAKLGGEMQLERALQSGEVVPVEDKGKIFYCIQSISITKEKGVTQSVNMQSAPRALEKESEMEALTTFFDTFDPALVSTMQQKQVQFDRQEHGGSKSTFPHVIIHFPYFQFLFTCHVSISICPILVLNVIPTFLYFHFPCRSTATASAAGPM